MVKIVVELGLMIFCLAIGGMVTYVLYNDKEWRNGKR